MAENFVSIIFPQSYVDFNDFERPVKTNLVPSNFDLASYSAFTKEINLSTVTLYDSVFSFFNRRGNTSNFFTQFKSDTLTKRTHQFKNLYASGAFGYQEFFSLEICLGQAGKIFGRQVYTYMDCLGEIGGIYGILSLFLQLFLGAYNSQVFKIEAVRSNFKIRPKRNN